MTRAPIPTIIQGGMGAGVSDWRLARAVSKAGQLGVVSGTGIDLILARRLQLGDLGGHIRRALESFPVDGVARRILDRYYVPGGKSKALPFKLKPLPKLELSRHLEELLVAGNFVEVFLAREGHRGPVGINYLEKIQLPTLPSLYGAMLAGVSCVLMGAGIPRAIPGILDGLAEGRPVELKIDVRGAERGEAFFTRFDPRSFCGGRTPEVARPDFLGIVSSATLATLLARKASGTVRGFVVEGPTAGGHNAPPRGPMRLSADGQPVYGEQDGADLEAMRSIGLPFWLAGSYADPDRYAEALAGGAAGIQVGTAFAYCEESGLDSELKRRVLELSGSGEARVFTDPVASPTGFPFKVLQLSGTLTDEDAYAGRGRVCDLGYLRHACKNGSGEIAWRCPAEPMADYVRKGGAEEDTRGRKCVCNALMANIGLGQTRSDGDTERPLVTSGDDVATVARFLRPGERTYRAGDVIERLLSGAVGSRS